jgi:hypothetical protein
VSRGEQFGRALAAISGDLRDWPKQCGWCRSENLTTTERGHLLCLDCRGETSEEIAYEDRCRRAKALSAD